MNVLMVEPGKAPYETQIGDDLQSMQAVVGGYIQAVYPYEEPVALIANESGKLDGLPLNRALRDADGDTLRGVYHVAHRCRAFMKHSVDNRG